jgi:hypothetical protein
VHLFGSDQVPNQDSDLPGLPDATIPRDSAAAMVTTSDESQGAGEIGRSTQSEDRTCSELCS